MDDNPRPESNQDPERSLLARMLYDEHTRLRAEVEELRRQQQQKSAPKEGEKKQDKQEGQQKQDDQSGDDKKEDEKNKKEKKPPLKQRVMAWVHKHPVGATLSVLGFVVLVVAAALLWTYLQSYENTDDAFVEGHIDPISPRIAGFVTNVFVENTYHVKKGQLLVELDPRDYVVAKDEAAANLAQAEASVRAQMPNVPITTTTQGTQVINAELSVQSAEASLTAAQEKYRSAIADLHQAEANQANAAREEQRYKLLVVKEEVSREMYDQRATESQTQLQLVASRRESADAASKAVTQAEAELHQAQQQAEQARKNSSRQIAIQHEMLGMRQAELKTAEARAEQAALNFQYTRIYAPADGIIGNRTVQIGMQIQPGQEMLALTESNDIWVTANFKETQIRRMRTGQSVTIHVDALKEDFDGYVEALPGGSGAVYSLLPPENATGNYVKVVQRLPVRIHFRAGQHDLYRLAPGMSVEPKVWLNR